MNHPGRHLRGNLEEQVRTHQGHRIDSRLKAPDVGQAPSGYQAILRSREIKDRDGARSQLRPDVHRQDGPRPCC